jgi:hypothetical protein
MLKAGYLQPAARSNIRSHVLEGAQEQAANYMDRLFNG